MIIFVCMLTNAVANFTPPPFGRFDPGKKAKL